MLHYRGEQAIVVRHDAEALTQGGFVVARGHSLAQIVGHDGVGIEQRQPLMLSFAHDANTPIEVGRESVLKVVVEMTSQVCAGKESLVTHEHAVAERTPTETFGGRQTTRTKKMTFVIH